MVSVHTMLFVFSLSFACGVVGSSYFDPCPNHNLTEYGEQVKQAGQINVFAYLTATGKLPCLGAREDWREMMPRCFQKMTSLPTYTYANDTGKCASCVTLKSIECSKVFTKKIALLVAVGGAHNMGLKCARHENLTSVAPRKCYFNEPKFLGPNFGSPSLYASAIRILIPIIWIENTIWAYLETAEVFGVAKGRGTVPWVVLSDHHLPKIANVVERDLTADVELEMKIEEDRRRFLYIGRVEKGKGQANFIRKVIEEKQYFLSANITFYFLLSWRDSPETAILQKAFKDANRAGLSPILKTAETKYPKKQLDALMRSSRGLIHFAKNDRNPRIIAEALVSRLPVLATLQSAPFSGLECAPPSVASLFDFSNPIDNTLAPLFERFLNATANHAIVEEEVSATLEGFALSRTHPCICSAIGLCGAPVLPNSYSHFSKVMKKGKAVVSPECAMGKNLEMVSCAKTDLNTCIRFGTWFEARIKRGKMVQSVFYHPFLKKFRKAQCYKKKDLQKFMALVGRSSNEKMARVLPLLPSHKRM